MRGLEPVVPSRDSHRPGAQPGEAHAFVIGVGGFNAVLCGSNIDDSTGNINIVLALNTGVRGVDLKGAAGNNQPASSVDALLVGALHRQAALPGESQVRGGVDGSIRVVVTGGSVVSLISDGVRGTRSSVDNCFGGAHHINGRPG